MTVVSGRHRLLTIFVALVIPLAVIVATWSGLHRHLLTQELRVLEHEQAAWLEENKYRPFCSKRCKLIDFGDWAAEKHIISGKRVSTEDDENQETLQ